jgi:hypothetical protein
MPACNTQQNSVSTRASLSCTSPANEVACRWTHESCAQASGPSTCQHDPRRSHFEPSTKPPTAPTGSHPRPQTGPYNKQVKYKSEAAQASRASKPRRDPPQVVTTRTHTPPNHTSPHTHNISRQATAAKVKQHAPVGRAPHGQASGPSTRPHDPHSHSRPHTEPPTASTGATPAAADRASPASE